MTSQSASLRRWRLLAIVSLALLATVILVVLAYWRGLIPGTGQTPLESMVGPTPAAADLLTQRLAPTGLLGAQARQTGEAVRAHPLGANTLLGVTGGAVGRGDGGTLWLPYTMAGDKVLPTYGTSVAVDAAGGIHVGYAVYAGADQGARPATYAFCRARCADKASWTFTRLGENVQDARIGLDRAGHPRLMLYGPAPDQTAAAPRSRYQFAACDTNCADASHWTITTVAAPIESNLFREYFNNRYFAMDPQGRPAFVYTDTSDNDHPGTFYMSCQANCTDARSWTETVLSTNTQVGMPALAFAPGGQPRLAFSLFDRENYDLYLAYAQCDRDCLAGDKWRATLLTVIHGSARYSLQADAQGRPRLALYSGSYASAPLEDHVLYYLWCDAGCSDSADPWYFRSVGLDRGAGDGVDMVLDTRSRPRMAFESATQGLGYAWCDSSCESGDGVWRSAELESQASLASDFEVLPIRRCTVSTWFNGQRASLALDASGNPRVGYDAQHWWYGYEVVNGQMRDCNFQDVTVTRFALFPAP